MNERYIPSRDGTPDVPSTMGAEKSEDIKIRTKYMGDKPKVPVDPTDPVPSGKDK